MKTIESMRTAGQSARQSARPSAKDQGVDALKALLRQVSQIKVKQIDFESPRPDLKVDILAQVEVHGHSHMLVCKVEASGRPDHVRTALETLRSDAAQFDADTTPVLIAPSVSDEAQALCTENKAGFLDLKGNARLYLGELFIGKRSMPQSVRGPQRLAGAA